MKRTNVTLLDVAKRSAVSKTTASKALNGHPGLRAETVARVRASARELGFTPNATARRLGAARGNQARSMMIGFLADRLRKAADDPYCFRVMVGVQRAAAAVSYHMVFGLSHETPEAQVDYVRQLGNGGVDGWILSDDRVNESVIRYLQGQEIPAVIVGDSVVVPGVTTVHSDNVGGAALATRHLIDLGHRRICFAAGSEQRAWAGMRQTGYISALRQAGLPHSERDILKTSDFTAFMERLTGGEPDAPTAIVAATDWIAVDILKMAMRAGIDVPRRLSVIGYDDAPWLAPAAHPSLSTIRVDFDRIGEMAFKALHDEIQGKKEPGTRLALPVELIVRDSTALAEQRT